MKLVDLLVCHDGSTRVIVQPCDYRGQCVCDSVDNPFDYFHLLMHDLDSWTVCKDGSLKAYVRVEVIRE